MLSDQAINHPNQDDFERDEFAKHIADILCLPQGSPSIVVAIEGSWGVGKTSTINLIKHHLNQNESKPIVVDFNPWLIGSLDSVIEGFLIQFATSINQEFKTKIANNVAAKILNLAKFLAPIKLIPGVEPWGTMVEKTLDAVGKSAKAAVDMVELSLSARKKDVQKAITKFKQPIIVIIDDIDRLPPQEVRIIFQVIKAVCDFERVSYLLACDPEPVSKALSYDNTYDGKCYLEKIVQVSYPLPRLGYAHRKNFLLKQLKNLLETQKRVLANYENNTLHEALTQTTVVRSLSTPREVIRLTNKLRISGERTINEVNFADVLLFEVISLKYPEIVQAIRNEPEQFLKTGNFDEDYYYVDPANSFLSSKDDKEDKEIQFINTLLQKFNLRDQENTRSILCFLFPKLLGRIPYDEGKAVVANRICTKNALHKLLNCGLSSFTYSAKDVLLFVESDEDREQILKDLLESNITIFEWLNYLESSLKNSKIVNPISLCYHLIKFSKNVYRQNKYNKYNVTRQVGGVLMSLLKSLPEETERNKVLNYISSNKINLTLSEDVLANLLREFGMWNSGRYYNPNEIDQKQFKQDLFKNSDLIFAKDTWLTTVRDVANSEGIINNEEEALSIFFRWGQFNNNDFSDVKSYISTVISKHGISYFLSLYKGKGLEEIEMLIADRPKFMSELEQVKEELPIADAIIGYLKKLESDKRDEQV